MLHDAADVVVVGGGVIGSSIALQLRHRTPALRVIVLERAPDYARASSRLAFGGIRQQYGSRLNVAMAQFSLAFYQKLDTQTGHTHRPTRSNFRQRGYLFLADATNSADVATRYEHAKASGALIERWTCDRIRREVPGLAVDDIEFASFGPADGYLDPCEALAGMRALAEAAGATYLVAELDGTESGMGYVTAAIAATGGARVRIDTPWIVNAAGAYAGAVAELAGIEVPVVPQRQTLFRVELASALPSRSPVIFDPDGTYWRLDDPCDGAVSADCLVVGRLCMDEPIGENFAVDMQTWHSLVAPTLARRYPAAMVRRVRDAWAGLFEMTPDQNGIIGEHPRLRGFLIAAGFSGHGLMLAPAIGYAVAELVCTGSCASFDLSLLAADRFERGQLFYDGALPAPS